jgi:predicted RNA-binding protein YlxR (DUF448 family)
VTRGGRPRETEDPERRCIVTGESGPKQGLIRFVAGPDGSVVPDVAAKLPGRGVYVTATREALDRAAKKGLFARALKQPVTVPDGLSDMVERLLIDRVVAHVALARKAGRAVCGFEKVRDALAKGGVRVLMQATDGSVRGKSKLWTPTGARYFAVLTAAELGLSFGREHAIHAALAAGGLAERVVEDAARLSGLRAEMGGGDPAARKD